MSLGPLTFSPAAFWLVPPVLAVLIWLRYFRTRRHEITAGSLLLWRRLAAQQPASPPPKMRLDRTLVLQALALLALITALSAPRFSLDQNRGRGLLLLVDNGPQARARSADGKPLWPLVLEQSRAILNRLGPDDTLFLARSSPAPRLLTPQGVSPAAALALLQAQTPALSGPDSAAIWLFASDTARSLAKDSALALAVVSLRDSASLNGPGKQWLCAAPQNSLAANVGIIDFGAAPIVQETRAATQILARLKNFSAQQADGSVTLESNGAPAETQTQKISLAPQSEQAVVFTLPKSPDSAVRIAWRRTDGKPDSLPEDDSVIAAPRPLRIPRVRFHAPVPAVEKLFHSALKAVAVAADDPAGVDLEIYAGSVPEKIPPASKAFLLLAPEAGYHSYFDVGEKILAWPKAQRDEADVLTRGIGDKAESLFAVPKACELRKTGDFRTLVKDARSERSLVARFSDEQQHPAFVLAFVPGAGMPPERLLEPELAAILVRIALHAAGSGDPFEIKLAAQWELQSGEPLALDWAPDFKDMAQSGGALLNEAVSALNVGRGGGENFDLAGLQPLERGREHALAPWLIALALALLVWEAAASQSSGAPRIATLKTQ